MTVIEIVFVLVIFAVAIALFAMFFNTPFEQGQEDYLTGMSKADCPYDWGSWQYECWHEGFDHQCRMNEIEELIRESKK